MTTHSHEADMWAIVQVVESIYAEKGRATPTLHGFLRYQATDVFYKQVAEDSGQAYAEYTIDKN